MGLPPPAALEVLGPLTPSGRRRCDDAAVDGPTEPAPPPLVEEEPGAETEEAAVVGCWPATGSPTSTNPPGSRAETAEPATRGGLAAAGEETPTVTIGSGDGCRRRGEAERARLLERPAPRPGRPGLREPERPRDVGDAVGDREP